MKKICTAISILIISTISIQAQNLHQYAIEYLKPQSKGLLTKSAFDKFIIDHYGFTILGAPSPTTGLKVETANPAITLRGSILANKTRTRIVTFELGAGVNNSLGEVFSGKKLHSQFKANLGLNVLSGNNSADYVTSNDQMKTLYKNKGYEFYKKLLLSEYEFKILDKLLDENFQSAPSADKIHEEIFGHLESNIKKESDPSNKQKLERHLSDENVRYRAVLRKVLSNYEKLDISYRIQGNDTIVTDQCIITFIDNWKNQDEKKIKIVAARDSIVNKYQKSSKISKTSSDTLFSYQMSLVNDNWRSKSIKWLNLSLPMGSNNFMLYDSTTNTLEERNKFNIGLKVTGNYLLVKTKNNTFTYVNGGLGIHHVNNIDELEDYSYKKSKTIKVPDPKDPNTQEAITDETTGKAYSGKYDDGLGVEAFFEIYTNFWKNAAAPGLYVKTQATYADHWLNKTKLLLMTGLMWNVKNSDKTSKNILTIVPFVKWSNILTQKKNAETNETVPLKDLFSVGFQVGIPINIGK